MRRKSDRLNAYLTAVGIWAVLVLTIVFTSGCANTPFNREGMIGNCYAWLDAPKVEAWEEPKPNYPISYVKELGERSFKANTYYSPYMSPKRDDAVRFDFLDTDRKVDCPEGIKD